MDPKLEKLARLVGEAMARRWMQIMQRNKSGRAGPEPAEAFRRTRNRKRRRVRGAE
jgi:hypothetical protein